MADWRIVTPTREPEDDEINTPSGMAPGNGYVLLSPGNFTILCGSSEPRLAFKIQNVQPVVTYYYNFTEKTWLDSSLEHIDITTVDLTIPEAAITGATVKTSYFDLIAFEKGTTACKLAVTNEAKTLIRNALINKGVDVPDTTPFRQYAGKVDGIETGSNIEILTFDIQPDDYEDVSSWYDEAYMNQYTEAFWHIHGPYVFKSKTYDSIAELLLDISSKNIYFSPGDGNFFFQRPVSIGDETFKFIFKNSGLLPETLYMIVNFGGSM